MDMHLVLDGDGPLYRQLARALRLAIEEGRLKENARLPASRILAASLAVSRNTVLSAYDTICSEGLAVARIGSGTYVASRRDPVPCSMPPRTLPAQSMYAARVRGLPVLPRMRVTPPARHSLEFGEPLVSLQILTAWRSALVQAAMKCEVRYPPAAGLPLLRAAISEYVGRRRGVACLPSDVVVVNGAQQALSLVARILVDPGSDVAVEDPFYPFAVEVLRAQGGNVRFIPVDDDGLRVDRLPSHGLRAIVVTPSHQFPSGVEMALARREALLAHARDNDCWIIEDDYDGEYRFEPNPRPALRALDTDGRVFYVGTFSKVMFPALRLGYVICPPGLVDDLIAAKRLNDLGCPGIEQAAMAFLMTSGGFDRHLRKVSIELRRRRAALLDGLARHCAKDIAPSPSRAGMHIVGWLPRWSTARTQELVVLARARGLGLHAIDHFYARRPSPSGLLLGYAAISVKQLNEATRILGRCLRELRSGPAPSAAVAASE